MWEMECPTVVSLTVWCLLATFNFMSLVTKQFALGYIASWVGERIGLEEGNRNLISCLRSSFVQRLVAGGEKSKALSGRVGTFLRIYYIHVYLLRLSSIWYISFSCTTTEAELNYFDLWDFFNIDCIEVLVTS